MVDINWKGMTYESLLIRRYLGGNYTHIRCLDVFSMLPDRLGQNMDDPPTPWRTHEELHGILHGIAGDMRRMEQCTLRPGGQRRALAKKAGVSEKTVFKVMKAFFGRIPIAAAHDNQIPLERHFKNWYIDVGNRVPLPPFDNPADRFEP